MESNVGFHWKLFDGKYARSFNDLFLRVQSLLEHKWGNHMKEFSLQGKDVFEIPPNIKCGQLLCDADHKHPLVTDKHSETLDW